MASSTTYGNTAGGSTTLLYNDTSANDYVVELPKSNGVLATTAYVDGKMVLSTAVTASGTSVDFTGIPSWVKRITVMFSGVSSSGVSPHLIQIGDIVGIETSGYSGGTEFNTVRAANSVGFLCARLVAAADIGNGAFTLVKITGNMWSITGIYDLPSTTLISISAGSKTLSAILDRVRITTVNGTDTFDAGSINIMYEG